MGLAGLCPDRRQPGSYPETGLEEIIGDLLQADLWIASILAHLLAFFQRGEPVGMYDE